MIVTGQQTLSCHTVGQLLFPLMCFWVEMKANQMFQNVVNFHNSGAKFYRILKSSFVLSVRDANATHKADTRQLLVQFIWSRDVNDK